MSKQHNAAPKYLNLFSQLWHWIIDSKSDTNASPTLAKLLSILSFAGISLSFFAILMIPLLHLSFLAWSAISCYLGFILSLTSLYLNRKGQYQSAIAVYITVPILIPNLIFLSTLTLGQALLPILMVSPLSCLLVGVFLRRRDLTLTVAFICFILPLGIFLNSPHSLIETLGFSITLLAVLFVYLGVGELYEIINIEHHANLCQSNAALKQEINERLLAEEQLKMFRFLVDNSMEGISITNHAGSIIYANAALHKMHGYDANSQEMLGFTHVHYTDPGFLDNLPTVAEALLAGQVYTGEAFRKRKDGSFFLCSYTCYPLSASRQSPLVASVISDITKARQVAIVETEWQAELLLLNQKLNQEIEERHAVEQSLSHEKQRIEAILNNIDDVVILMSVDSTIQVSNYRLQAALGYTERDVLGSKLFQFVVEDSWAALNQYIQKLLSGNQVEAIEIMVIHKDGSLFTNEISLHLVSDEAQDGIVCTLRDLSAKQLLIHDLRKLASSQKALADLKTRIISTVSHEYRTPLAVIKSSTDLLSRYYERLSSSQRQQHVEKIQTQIIRMTDLLNDVIEINRMETMGTRFEPEWLILDSLCMEIVEDYRRIYPQHKIELTISGIPIPIYADPKLMRQIVSNLLSNATKYSPASSCVRIYLNFGPAQIRLLVQDKGIGIPQEDIENLFLAFHRASNVENIQGTGLGLAIVKQAVDAHGGTISVESQVGEGSQFSIYLPVLAPEGRSIKSSNLAENG